MIIHTPEDLTLRVGADLTLADVQTALAKAGQWLPLDPPNPGRTLRAILDRNDSGPHRFGYGTARDYVIGLTVRLADGRLAKSGGQVVKNVAGYDLQKLFIGCGGTLATAVEATFKLRPLPESSRCVQQRLETLEAAGAAIEAVMESELMPVVFDLHRLGQRAALSMVLGFDGTVEDVDWQLALAAGLGFQEPAGLEYNQSFCAEADSLRKVSVLPSRLIETLRGLGAEPFVARAGNGIIFHRADLAAPEAHLPARLLQRVKDIFDPGHLLPELPA